MNLFKKSISERVSKEYISKYMAVFGFDKPVLTYIDLMSKHNGGIVDAYIFDNNGSPIYGVDVFLPFRNERKSIYVESLIQDFVIDDNKLKIENPKISTIPAKSNKFLV